MPGGEKTAIVSKKHQMDILMDKLAEYREMAQTPEGRKRFDTLFGDNAIMQRMIKTGEMPLLVQILGGNIYTNGKRDAFNAGQATANEIHQLQAELIYEAIQAGEKTKAFRLS